jgi:hypothetical protein
MKVIVYHAYYGCDTGCCGHRIELQYPDEMVREAFDFGHCLSDQDPIDFARQLVTEQFGEQHVADLDWDNCRIETSEGCSR